MSNFNESTWYARQQRIRYGQQAFFNRYCHVCHCEGHVEMPDHSNESCAAAKASLVALGWQFTLEGPDIATCPACAEKQS